MKPHGFNRAFRLGVTVFAVALILQTAILGVIGLMESIGQEEAQRTLLQYVELFCEPALHVFRMIIPERWLTLGNVLLGFLGLGFSVISYSALMGIAGVLLSWTAHPSSRDRPERS